jgi:hypothetical protein
MVAAVFVAGVVIGAAAGIWWALRKVPAQPIEPRRAHWVGVGPQTIGIGSIDGERLRAIFKAIDVQTLVEIKRP